MMFASIIFATPFLAMFLLSRYYKTINRERGIISRRFSPLIEGIKIDSKNALIYYYYGIFLIQRLALGAVIVFLIDFPSAQVFSIMFSNIVFIFYIYKARPM